MAAPLAAARADTRSAPGQVYTGLSGGTSAQLASGSRDAVLGVYTQELRVQRVPIVVARRAGLLAADAPHLDLGRLRHARGDHAAGIARGKGDRYLLSLNRRIAEDGEPVYVRLMAEMNQANNGYCAFNGAAARARRPLHSRVQATLAALR